MRKTQKKCITVIPCLCIRHSDDSLIAGAFPLCAIKSLDEDESEGGYAAHIYDVCALNSMADIARCGVLQYAVCDVCDHVETHP